MGNSPLKILAWNVQGAGSSEFMNVLKEHIRLQHPSIIARMETHIAGARAQSVCDRIGFGRCFRVEAQGFQGGIWVLWRPEEVKVNIIRHHEQYVTMEVRQHRHHTWLLTVVYASPHVNLRETLWIELLSFAQQCTHPWPVTGDFNDTISLDERNHGGPEMQRRCTRFKHWIENTGLIDLGYSGPKFTWSRGRDWSTIKKARLDRALCNTAWRLKFQEGAVRHLMKAQSDHAPILIATTGFIHLAQATKPFHF